MNRLVGQFRDALQQCVTQEHRLAIALSGGPDSMALAALTANWRNLISGATPQPPLALIVDHKLRPCSGTEAAQSAQQATQLGLQAHVLRVDWGTDGPPTQNKKMTAARDARYSLLFKACQEYGVQNLLMAHHADDQAETFLLRLIHASGIDGLACMPLMSDKYVASQGVRIIRPLLQFHKQELVGYCNQQGLWYARDPSNDDVSFHRNFLRQAIWQDAPDSLVSKSSGKPPAAVADDDDLSNVHREEAEEDLSGLPSVIKDALILQDMCQRASQVQQQQAEHLLKQCILWTSPGLSDLPRVKTPAPKIANTSPDSSTSNSIRERQPRLSTRQLQHTRPFWYIDWRARLRGISQKLGHIPHVIVRLGPWADAQNCPDDGTAVAAVSRLLHSVAGGTYPPSLSDCSRLAQRIGRGRLLGAFTGGKCVAQPVTSSKGRYVLVYPQTFQSTVYALLHP